METNKHVLNKGWAEERNCTQSKLQQFYVRMFASAALWGKHIKHTHIQTEQNIETRDKNKLKSAVFFFALRSFDIQLFVYIFTSPCVLLCSFHFMCSAVVLCLFSYFFDDVLLWFLYSQLMCVYRTYPRTYICVHACRYVYIEININDICSSTWNQQCS